MSFCKCLKMWIPNKLYFVFVLSSSVQRTLKILKYLFICICCIMQDGSHLPCLLYAALQEPSVPGGDYENELWDSAVSPWFFCLMELLPSSIIAQCQL